MHLLDYILDFHLSKLNSEEYHHYSSWHPFGLDYINPITLITNVPLLFEYSSTRSSIQKLRHPCRIYKTYILPPLLEGKLRAYQVHQLIPLFTSLGSMLYTGSLVPIH
jgi:hypothetical protein